MKSKCEPFTFQSTAGRALLNVNKSIIDNQNIQKVSQLLEEKEEHINYIGEQIINKEMKKLLYGQDNKKNYKSI